MVMESGLSIPEVARRLSIPKSTLAHWVKRSKEGKVFNNNRKKYKSVTQEEMELAELRRENRVLSVSMKWLLHMVQKTTFKKGDGE